MFLHWPFTFRTGGLWWIGEKCCLRIELFTSVSSSLKGPCDCSLRVSRWVTPRSRLPFGYWAEKPTHRLPNAPIADARRTLFLVYFTPGCFFHFSCWLCLWRSEVNPRHCSASLPCPSTHSSWVKVKFPLLEKAVTQVDTAYKCCFLYLENRKGPSVPAVPLWLCPLIHSVPFTYQFQDLKTSPLSFLSHSLLCFQNLEQYLAQSRYSRNAYFMIK